jgi:broad specificity phosphatase PhoE
MISSVKHIILVRHGETTSNRDGFVLGQSDAPLTDKGRAIIPILAISLKSEQIEKIFSSPLGRAVSTAEIYSEILGLEFQTTEAMAELSAGQWESRPRSEVLGEKLRIRTNWTEKPPGGESYEDGESRVEAFIHQLRNELESQRILIVGHAAVNQVFLKLWLKLEHEQAMRIAFPHDISYFLDSRESLFHRRINYGKRPGLLFDTI